MKQYAVTVEDNKANFFLEILKSFKFVKKIEEGHCSELSAKQKSILDKRLDNYTPDNLIYLDDVKKDIEKSL
ncbi:MAG: hypothetical protein HGB12_00650 [Bacteroidetes bacterium]|nr:hypothetical protein [Bacteroidota bacterium]